jgi:membrane fusion protein, multidrug efflux system
MNDQTRVIQPALARQPRTAWGRSGWVVAALGAVLIAVVAWFVLHPKPAKTTAPQPVSVSVAQVATQDVPLTITVLGAAQAWTSDTILAQVSGMLRTVDFVEGSNVKAGQLLAQIDPAPYTAALTQAQGTLQRDQALLAGARVDLARYATLTKQDSIANQTYQDQIATVKEDEGTVLIDQGAVSTAQVNLDWCRITSPIDGRAGVRLTDAGNYVTSDRVKRMGAQIARRTEDFATTDGREFGSAIARPRGQSEHRPGRRLTLWDHAGEYRRRDL